ncbi:hypothetical protein A5719_00035 [Mycolicibacterium peregrinum]|nr:hypothetical protein A5719_00035 [Mycolicibacterium peregrinum]
MRQEVVKGLDDPHEHVSLSLANEHLHSYVLSLPVSTQIAEVRGHDGYGFPKWVTGLDVSIDPDRTVIR